MKSTIALLGATSASALNHEAIYMNFLAQQGVSHATKAEFDFRLNIFKASIEEHERFNSLPGQTSTQGINQFSDRTESEIAKLLGYKDTYKRSADTVYEEEEVNDTMTVDWFAKGVISEVKNQGHCGSCWSFSTTGALEASHTIQTGEQISLSEQQLVDCCFAAGGCHGGNMAFAFAWTMLNPLMLEAEYPYKAVGGKCHSDRSKGKVKALAFAPVLPLSASALKSAIKKTPVSVALKADKPAFHQYTGGIITKDCGLGPANHGVLAVGYGTSPEGVEYYLVKNSWGTAYGVNGYVKVGVSAGLGTCSIQEMPSYPRSN